jgi:hypothetical protein
VVLDSRRTGFKPFDLLIDVRFDFLNEVTRLDRQASTVAHFFVNVIQMIEAKRYF